MKLTKDARLVVAVVIAIVGGLGGLAVWAFAAPVQDDPLADYTHSKSYQAQLERVGGKAAVFGDEAQEWLASLVHGPTLGLTIAGLSVAIAGGFLFFTRERAR